VAVFVNHGRDAGASIAHPHAQIVGVGFVPDAVAAIASRFASAPADLLLADLATAQRANTVLTDGPAPVWCPPAAASPYELRVAAPTGGPRFDRASDDEVAAVATGVRRALDALRRVLGDHAYNVVVHTGPGDDPFHWFVSIVPRVAVVAGFELGTGVFVNTVAPESAAAVLRSHLR
jgi:UDPglucose--hexose-1-phosphate uridylyltransferase